MGSFNCQMSMLIMILYLITLSQCLRIVRRRNVVIKCSMRLVTNKMSSIQFFLLLLLIPWSFSMVFSSTASYYKKFNPELLLRLCTTKIYIIYLPADALFFSLTKKVTNWIYGQVPGRRFAISVAAEEAAERWTCFMRNLMSGSSSWMIALCEAVSQLCSLWVLCTNSRVLSRFLSFSWVLCHEAVFLITGENQSPSSVCPIKGRRR